MVLSCAEQESVLPESERISPVSEQSEQSEQPEQSEQRQQWRQVS